MAYFKIFNNDYSTYVSGLNIKTKNNYYEAENAAGNIIVDYINSKRVITVEIIPLKQETMEYLLNDLSNFNLTISFKNPSNGELEEDLPCIIADYTTDYYRIGENKTLYKKFKLKFEEL